MVWDKRFGALGAEYTYEQGVGGCSLLYIKDGI